MYLADIYTVTGSLAGVPGISVPCGKIGGKLPVGLQIFGPAFGEAKVLQLAHAFEQAGGGSGLIEPNLLRQKWKQSVPQKLDSIIACWQKHTQRFSVRGRCRARRRMEDQPRRGEMVGGGVGRSFDDGGTSGDWKSGPGSAEAAEARFLVKEEFTFRWRLWSRGGFAAKRQRLLSRRC